MHVWARPCRQPWVELKFLSLISFSSSVWPALWSLIGSPPSRQGATNKSPYNSWSCFARLPEAFAHNWCIQIFPTPVLGWPSCSASIRSCNSIAWTSVLVRRGESYLIVLPPNDCTFRRVYWTSRMTCWSCFVG